MDASERLTLRAWLDRPVDASSVALFRIGFGLAMIVLAARFFVHGWIHADFVAPRVFFSYWGLGFVRPLPGIGMYVLYAVMALSAALVAVGLAYRAAAVTFAFVFAWCHFSDKANWLNHYWLVTLLSLCLVVLPLDREASLRVLRRPHDRRSWIRRWMLLVLQVQVGVVYVFGGIAKLGRDWLLDAEPLRIWLAANVELPVLGRYFLDRRVAFAFSWAGLLFDLTIVIWLSWRRTRPLAYLVVLVFHGLTGLLFPIGMFPVIMSIGATLFFDPSWARRVLGRANDEVAGGDVGWRLPVLGAWALVQVLVPLRHLAYPGNTLWTEEGFRFAWRVMLVEKMGTLEYTVVERDGRRHVVEPREYLTPFQARMTATQPDMILELAHVIAADHDAVAVYAEAHVSWNGRPNAPLVDPTVDLAHETDSLLPKRWILPAPDTRPWF